MNKEINKIISWVEMSYTRLNYKEELLLVNYIKQLQQENKQLKDNWNELKVYFTNITNCSPIDDNPLCEILIMTYEDINNKMQELEKGDSNE